MTETPLRIAVVAGEESGDLLAADLLRALAKRAERPLELVGVGGEHLATVGLTSLFNPGEIALMGISAVVCKLPSLIRRIGETARSISNARPDLLLIVDSPDFTHRVARKVRAALPGLPIVNYVCPSVWAWRPGRAKAMTAYVDHVLCLLPFEPDELERLGGPAGTFVGHRLTSHPGLAAACKAQDRREGDPVHPVLAVLPGSRRSEVLGLLEPFGETVDFILSTGLKPRLVIPTVPHVEAMVRQGVQGWAIRPEIVTGEAARMQAFAQADAALAASGTVTLELALAGVPVVSCYKTDLLAKALRHLIVAWSASLPNLILDRPVVPELYDFMLRPGYAGRHLLALMEDGPAREAQRSAFRTLRQRMDTGRPAGEIGADILLGLIERQG